MSLLDELISVALIGTARSGTPSISLPVAVEAAAKQVDDGAPEHRLLAQAALLNAYLRSGLRPGADGDLPAKAEVDERSRCSDRAADLLSDLIRDNTRELIDEWLALAAAAKRRVPHRLLPDLLELARKDKSLRQAVASVVDNRGRWLISHNPDWQFAAIAESIDEGLWETGTPEQRLTVARSLRQSNPTRACELLQKTWKDDPADQRAEFLRQFVIGLSPADESVLEGFLEDRSKQVRQVAADLLGRLPQSQLVQRMIARTSSLLTFKRGLIKGTKLEIKLPPELDKEMMRDGIEKSPPQGTGEKQWWLQQMLSFVPPGTWANVSGIAPTDVISAMVKTDFADILINGLSSAAERHPDPKWLDPLLRFGLEKSGRLNRSLLAGLTAQQFTGLAIDVLRHKRVTLVACSDLINNGNTALDLPAARLWVRTVTELANRSGRDEWTILWHLPDQCATRIPAAIRADIESQWVSDKEPWNLYRGQIEKLLKVLDTRLQIQKEFTL